MNNREKKKEGREMERGRNRQRETETENWEQTQRRRERRKKEYTSRVNTMINRAVAPSTRIVYDRNWKYWTDFCKDMGVNSLPGDPEDFAGFMVERADEHKSVAVATNAIAAVKERHSAAGLISPTDDVRVHRALKGIQKTYTRPVKQAPPMTAQVMKKLTKYHLKERAGRSNVDKLRAWRTIFRLRLCHTGLLRYNEVMNLERRDLEFGRNEKGEEYLAVTVRKSKTDQEGKGEKKYIPESDDKSICMVTLARLYLAALKEEPNVPLQQEIVVVNKQGLAKYTGQNIDRKQADKDRHWLLEQAGMPKNAFTEHSGRRGGAVAIMNKGATKDELRRAGGWKTDVMPEHYAKNSVERSTKVAKLIG